LKTLLDEDPDTLDTIIAASTEKSAEDTEDNLGLQTKTYVLDYPTSAPCETEGQNYHIESTLMHCLTSAINCINDTKFTTNTDAAACVMFIALDSSAPHQGNLKLIERPEKQALLPLIVSTTLIACGLLVGLKAAEMRQFTAGTMTMSSVCALTMTVTVGFGIEMTKGWFMITLLLALSISVFTADKVSAKHL